MRYLRPVGLVHSQPCNVCLMVQWSKVLSRCQRRVTGPRLSRVVVPPAERARWCSMSAAPAGDAVGWWEQPAACGEVDEVTVAVDDSAANPQSGSDELADGGAGDDGVGVEQQPTVVGQAEQAGQVPDDGERDGAAVPGRQ